MLLQAYQVDWEKIARPNQLEPEGNWHTWLILAGRGFGKTRTGSETIKSWVQQNKASRIALIGETERDVRDVMIEGITGLLNVYPEKERPQYIPSRQTIIWPSGAVAHVFSGVNYKQLRGPQFDAAWIDELAKFQYAQETWDQLMFGLRMGEKPRVIVTTTPRPIPLLHKLIKSPTCHVTRGSTLDNKDNLSEAFLQHILEIYEETSLGRQEIYGEINDEYAGALWTAGIFKYETPPGDPFKKEA